MGRCMARSIWTRNLVSMAKARLPKYMRGRRLANGEMSYYWEPPTWAKKRQCPIFAEALGAGLAPAIQRADDLNRSFDEWRRGELSGPIPGSVDWVIGWYQKHPKYRRLRPKTKIGYDANLILLADFKLKTVRFGAAPARKVEPKHADEMYQRIQWTVDVDPATGEETERRRLATANAVMRTAQAMWKVALRAGHVEQNPFAQMGLEQTGGHTVAATRDQVYTFVEKADAMGYQSMGTAAVMAFEMCQREGDVIGTISWSGYRPSDAIKVRQAKTDELVWLPLMGDGGKPLFPEVEERLARTPQRGSLIVMRDQPDKRTKTFLPYKQSWFGHLFRKIANAAGLPKELKFMGFRHGGLTELGEAGATDQEMMATSGHKTRGILTVYSKRTPQQAANAARKRQAWRTKKEGLSE